MGLPEREFKYIHLNSSYKRVTVYMCSSIDARICVCTPCAMRVSQ